MRSTFAPHSIRVGSNNTFNIGGKKFGTMRENFQAVLDRAGHGKHVVSLPAGPAIWILKFLEQIHVSPIYKWIYDTAARGKLCIDRTTRRKVWVSRRATQTRKRWFATMIGTWPIATNTRARLVFLIVCPGRRARSSSRSVFSEIRAIQYRARIAS